MSVWEFTGPGDVRTPDGTTLPRAVRADGVALREVPDGSLVMLGARVIVDAPTWFDARAYALSVLGEDLTWIERAAAEPDAVLRWVGTDAGRTPNRRLVVETAADRRPG